MSQHYIISHPTCRSLGSSICQVTSGQVFAQLSLSLRLSFMLTGEQLSQLQKQKCWKKCCPSKTVFSPIFLYDGCHLPDGDICKFFWSNCDALWSKIKLNPFSKPGSFPHSHGIFENIKRIWEAIFFNDMAFTICFVLAFTVSSCGGKIQILRKFKKMRK